MKQNKNLLKVLLGVVLLLCLAGGMFLLYQNFKPEVQKGAKTIEIEVVIPEKDTVEFTLHTDAIYLRQALDEVNLIQGEDLEYGLFLTTVNDRVADSTNQEWWCITRSGEQIMYGIDQITIQDGEHYEITLTVGY